MNIDEDTVNPIVKFLHNLLGNQLWILPTAIAITCWLLWWLVEANFWLLFSAVLCSLISTLLLLTVIVTKISSWIKNNRIKREKEYVAKQAEEQRLNEIEYQERLWADEVWKLVGHKEFDMVRCYPYFLKLEIHDNQECTRFIHWPKDNDREAQRILNALNDLVTNLTFPNPYHSATQLIRAENIRDGVYFHIDPYFYKLIKHFQETDRWEKV